METPAAGTDTKSVVVSVAGKTGVVLARNSVQSFALRAVVDKELVSIGQVRGEDVFLLRRKREMNKNK